MSYHHGDLRAALIQASFELLAESGLQRFSVAAVARRLEVSSAAPYRHFPDRAHLLGAVSAVAARDLRAEIEEASPPGLAAAAEVYVRYVARTGAGFHVIYATELRELPDDARREETRALMTTLLDLAWAAGAGSHREAVALIEATIAVAHGYWSLYAEGFFTGKSDPVDQVAERAAAAAGALISR
ncbi:MAG: TetR/AcrR family transcriptional regulator [Actinoplanes sp.]